MSEPSGELTVKSDGFSDVSLSKAYARPGAWLRRPGVGIGFAVLAIAAMGPSLAMAQAALGGGNKPFTIGAQVSAGYDTNPARGNSVDANARGISNDEVTVSPSITAVYSHSAGQLGLALEREFRL